jgi:ribosomal protein L7/L12
MKIALTALFIWLVLWLLTRSRREERTSLPPSRDSALPSGDPKETILRLLRSGHKIEAIKHHRQHFGTGLKEAKQAVEQMARERLGSDR